MEEDFRREAVPGLLKVRTNIMDKKRKLISMQMLLYEFRNTIGNIYVHIFGVGMPVLMLIIITRAITAETPNNPVLSVIVTSVFLGTGSLIPLATVLMGYGISHAQEMEKGIPQRMELFGIRAGISICNRALSEIIFMFFAFCVYFVVGFLVVGVEAPKVSGILLYLVCILALSVILFGLAHAISTMLKKVSLAYCVTMLLYFAMMMLGGMMGISYENMPSGIQMVAKLLPVTYLNRDFYTVWSGGSYNFVPMLQSYLLLAAVAGILLFLTMRREPGRRH